MSASDEILSGAQCRAARALTDISRTLLADQSAISETLIRDFENRIAEPDNDIRAALRRALEAMGATFIADDEHGGEGVRLTFNAGETARIESLENEGGAVGETDVPD